MARRGRKAARRCHKKNTRISSYKRSKPGRSTRKTVKVSGYTAKRKVCRKRE